jgi:ABC-type nickel/cobalt efflux system permease component RcnA
MFAMLCRILLVLAGLWLGVAVPFALFLATGVSLPVIVLAGAVTSLVILRWNERRTRAEIRPYLRSLFGGAGGGLLILLMATSLGVWSFGE